MKTIEVCNIWKSECNVKLKDGEELCPFCKGQGGKFANASFKQRYFSIRECLLCHGEGKVDWIQATTQKVELLSPKGYPRARPSKDIKMRCIGQQHCKKTLLRLWKRRDDRDIGPCWIEVY